jgi:hypothetical protein
MQKYIITEKYYDYLLNYLESLQATQLYSAIAQPERILTLFTFQLLRRALLYFLELYPLGFNPYPR